jgi:putative colanic acid biosynthesis acetyltransferase WcaF
MKGKSMDYVYFKSPYSTMNRIYRSIWNITWTVFARPFPKSTMMPWKRFLLRVFGANISNTSAVYASAKIFMPSNLIMKDYACIASDVDCYNAAQVIIGINATVSCGTYLCTASHDIMSPHHEQTEAPIELKDRSWVAARAYIGPGVTIGEGAVVGATASVYKDVEPWTVVGGNPAKFIKKRIIREK